MAAAAPAARAAMDRISHGVDFDTTPIETALNWGRPMKLVSLQLVANDQRRQKARNVREALFSQCRSIVDQLGDDVSGFALVAWDRQGELRSTYYTGYGPLRPALIPTLVGDALNRHVTLGMAPPTDGKSKED